MGDKTSPACRMDEHRMHDKKCLRSLEKFDRKKNFVASHLLDRVDDSAPPPLGDY